MKKIVSLVIVLAIVLSVFGMSSRMSLAREDMGTEPECAERTVSEGGVASGSAVTGPAAGADEEDDFQYEVIDYYDDISAVIITKFNEENTDKNIVVPDTIDGYPVMYIDSYAFDSAKFQTIKLPESLKRIESGAFYACPNLKEITIPAGVTEISDYAFAGCSKLKEIHYQGNKLDRISSSMFYGCKKLEEIELPNSVKEIEYEAFSRCSKLSRVTLGKKLKTIGSNAFSHCFALKSIRIPASVDKIQQSAFRHCKNMTSIDFLGNSTKFEKKTFDGCASLKKITISNKMKNIPEYAFSGCVSLKKVTLPTGTKLIKEKAFTGCSSLRKIKLGNKIYAIGGSAFKNSGLKSIRLNKNLQYIGNGAFKNTELGAIHLPGRVTYIGNCVFAGCDRLKTISIPASVRGLNPGALNGCTSLTNITVASGNANYSSQNGVLFDKNKTKLLQYPINKSGSSYTVPSSVEVIRSHAFELNKKLESVSVSAEKIHNHSFSQMKKLKSVTIGSGVTNIAAQAFSNNYKLKNVNMADSVRVIAYEAFSGSAITRIRIPASIRSLSDSAFDDCSKIEAYEGRSSGKFPVIDGVLYQNGGKTLRSYPPGKKDRTFNVPAKVRHVLQHGIWNVKTLKKLYFTHTIKNLDSDAIYRCPKLKQIVFEEGTKLSSGYYAVDRCNKLAVIVGPKQSILESMARNAGATLITL